MLLELNDVALTLHSPTGILYQEPAQALVEHGELIFGSAALAASRLHPLESSNSYLDKLSTEPLPRPLGSARTYADLVYHHFLQLAPLAGSEPLCVSVSANVGNEQLAILLGIAAEAGLTIGSFVDGAVLACSILPEQPATTFVDIQTHHLAITRLIGTSGELTRDMHQIVSGCGTQGIMDGWTALIADGFVQATRFDPLHSAASEQQLVNQLRAWRQQQPVTESELRIDITLGNDARRTIVTQEALIAKTATRLQPMTEVLSREEAVVLSAQAAGVPGVPELLTACAASVTTLGSNHLTQAFAAQPALSGPADSVRMHTRLPIQAVADLATSVLPNGNATAPQSAKVLAEPAITPTAPPTHVLRNGTAHSIDTSLLEMQLPIARSGQSFCVMPGESPLLDSSGEPLAVGSALPAGRTFVWQGVTYQLITVSGH